jgi:class 3 adenylate cyclase
MGTSELLTEISEIYLLNNEFDLATESAYRSLHLAKMNNLKPQISDAYKLLSEIYEKSRKGDQALDNYKNYIIYRDSVKNLSSIQEIANMRTDFEVSQKQTEVDLLNRQKKTQQILVFTMLASLLITVVYFKNISRAKKRSDELLLNILPSKTAEELKKNGKVEAKKFESASVMFTDFQAFTKYSQKLTPEILVKSVDYFFCQFDRIIEKYQLEKIKTIGDAYMCAGGIPKENQHHAVDIIFAAFEIIDFINESKENKDKEIAHFDIRIGINTGPVVAGVVGEKKFAYDIWGDTVNVASRMETNSIAGMINISEDTYALVKDYFECEYRGEIEVKNKGMMKMYFVKGKKNSNQNSNDASDKIVLC